MKLPVNKPKGIFITFDMKLVNFWRFGNVRCTHRILSRYCSTNIDNNAEKFRHSVGKLFQPYAVVPTGSTIKNSQHHTTSKSQKLMLDLGIMRQSSPGMFHMLPLGVKAMEKLVRLIEAEMQSIGAQRLELSHLISRSLWEATGRWDKLGDELFKLHDRQQRDFCLGPTYEESITDMIASAQLSYKHLPLLLYQINKKYRDELKPRFGLLRGKEFVMKDLYSFDSTEELAKLTYEKVCSAYENLLGKKLKLNFTKVLANPGTIGGTLSHEFHLSAEIGEDKIVTCESCGFSANHELHSNPKCPKCSGELQSSLAIEVGHTFHLGTIYSKPLKATFVDKSSKASLLTMGCYGLGVSRILAASIEVLSESEEIRWPALISPYLICIIPPKKGSKEHDATSLAVNLYKDLVKICPDDVIYDDRDQMTIGYRLVQAKRTGYPFIVVIGKQAQERIPRLELHDLYRNQFHLLTFAELLSHVAEELGNIQKAL